jgi:hypothetical protein
MTDTTRLRTNYTPITVEDLTDDLLRRFWAKIDVRGEDDCWEWQAYRNRAGYGIIGTRGRSSAVASRLALAIKLGGLTPEQLTLHSCDNPPCCNPAHLSAGTHRDNAIDRSVKGRSMRGESHVTAKLTEDDVRAIRALAASGLSHRKIGAKYDIDAATVFQIKHRRSWVHVA